MHALICDENTNSKTLFKLAIIFQRFYLMTETCTICNETKQQNVGKLNIGRLFAKQLQLVLSKGTFDRVISGKHYSNETVTRLHMRFSFMRLFVQVFEAFVAARHQHISSAKREEES